MRSRTTVPVIFDPLRGIIELRDSPTPRRSASPPPRRALFVRFSLAGSLLCGLLGVAACLLPIVWPHLAPVSVLHWAGELSEYCLVVAQVLFALGAAMGLLAVLGRRYFAEPFGWQVFGVNLALTLLMIGTA